MRSASEIQELLYVGAKEAFEWLASEHGRANIRGFGLCTCDDLFPFDLIAHTGDAGDPNTFAPDDWNTWLDGRFLREAASALEEHYEAACARDQAEDDWMHVYDDYTALFESSCLEALARLARDGVWGTELQRDDLFVVLHVGDSETEHREKIRWAEYLNTTSEFRRFFDSLPPWARSEYEEWAALNPPKHCV